MMEDKNALLSFPGGWLCVFFKIARMRTWFCANFTKENVVLSSQNLMFTLGAVHYVATYSVSNDVTLSYKKKIVFPQRTYQIGYHAVNVNRCIHSNYRNEYILYSSS